MTRLKSSTGTVSSDNLPVGTEFVKSAIDSQYSNVITETSGGNKTLPTDAANESNGKGTGVTIEYNSKNLADGPLGIKNADGTTGRKPYIGLGHELVHTQAENRGTVDKTVTNAIDTDTGYRRLDPDEVHARYEDSRIRKEQGTVERAVPTRTRN